MKAVSRYVSAVKAAPREIMSTFKGPGKVKHILFAAGGALGTFALGGIVTQSVLVPILGRVGAANLMVNPISKRIVGGMVPFTVGYIGSKFIKNKNLKRALQVGGAIASLVEIASPGMMAGLFGRVTSFAPGQVTAMIPPAAKAGPVHGMFGLDGYVDSPAYQGTGGYVDSPAYQGTGADNDMAGYVDSPAYQGTGDQDDDLAASGDDVMAGVEGYLEQSQAGYASYLN